MAAEALCMCSKVLAIYDVSIWCMQAPDAENVTVIQEDFWDALDSLQPSLSHAELQRYQKLRDHYESRGR